MDWPAGIKGAIRLCGRARDLLTPRDGSAALILSEDTIEVLMSAGRETLSTTASRCDEAVRGLVGARAGGRLRAAIARCLPSEAAAATPLHLLLDDLSGASLVAGWAWSQWPDAWSAWMRERARETGGRVGPMTNVCAGWREGSSALTRDDPTDPDIQSVAATPPLPHPDDPLGWHDLPTQRSVGLRRARRTDVWLDGVVHIEAGFQDSGTSAAGGSRIAVHEYRVAATADAETFELLTLDVDPRVLPYGECLSAPPNASRMLGLPLGRFRTAVPDGLPGILGCTHLNDVLRSFADVPQLVARLRAELAQAGG